MKASMVADTQQANRAHPQRFNAAPILQVAVHVAAWVPLAVLALDYWRTGLGANPIQVIMQRTGKTALVLLALSLACTPLATFGWRGAVRLRRPLGVYAFVYAALHFLTFIGLDYGFNLAFLRDGLIEKPFALVGLAAGLMLLPLAVTSTRASMKYLGRNWRRLHWLVYVAAPLAVVHYLLQVKADYRQPLLFGVIVALLFALRLAPVRRTMVRLRQWLRAKVASRPRGDTQPTFSQPPPDGKG
jgi:methionine sulfoxide reductase heme-binding subunit